MAELYTGFFGLRERPFTLLPDPDFIFWSQQHSRAFSVLEYGIVSRAPITVITGEVGAGKTTLVQGLLKSISEDVTLGLVSNAGTERGEVLHWVCNALGMSFDHETPYVALFQLFQDFVIGEYAAGRRVILIFDEAQTLSMAALEELRMLTNINSNKDELLQLVLVGQPELRALIAEPALRQFAQRVTANYHLREMDAATTARYIEHRLKVAGGSGAEFTSQACERVFRFTRGVPRLVNQLCDFCLVYALAENEPLVIGSVVDQVVEDGVYFPGYSGVTETEK
ncbi:MAG: AAA family ATPase [Pseudomonadota bacterium]